MMNRISCAAVAALLLAVSACSSDATKGAGPPATIQLTASPAASVGTGASAGVFAVKVSDAGGTPVSGATVSFTVSGGGTADPSSVATDAAGVAQSIITAGSVVGQMTVKATVKGLVTQALVNVVALQTGTCVTPEVGKATGYSSVSSLCLTGAATATEYTMVAFNADTAVANTATVTGTGLGTAPSTSMSAAAGALASLSGSATASTLVPDLEFHRRLMLRNEALASRIPGARRWQSAVRSARLASSTSTRSASASTASFNALGGTHNVGDLVPLNVNGTQACTKPDVRVARIVAIGSKSIVLADTANPAGGFTTDDYQRFAARFDTLVYPVDVSNFGEPSDIDGNGKVGILFTKAVNQLTDSGSTSYIGGFFFGRDLFPKDSTREFGAGCAGSNEAEMFYILAPDPNGEVNGNVRTKGLVDTLSTGTIAHEFQHLINASRRIYVNTTATDYEVVWLNEGLSHIAEELLYYRETGRNPRMDLTDADIRLQSSNDYNLWKQDMAQNFQRFSSYLANPAANSPDFDNDDLATRGATWAFLRYAADRYYPTDAGVWFKLVNSTGKGFATLNLAFGNDQVSNFRDWNVSNYFDDAGVPVDDRYQQKSWNYHDIYTKTFLAKRYPLKVIGLVDATATTTSIGRNSAAFYRLTVPAGSQAHVNLAASGAPAAALQFILIRTK